MSDLFFALTQKNKKVFSAEKMDSDFDCDEYDEEYESDSEYESESENVADIIGDTNKPKIAQYELIQRTAIYSEMDQALQNLQSITGLSYVSFDSQTNHL